jgi:cell division protein FtsW
MLRPGQTIALCALALLTIGVVMVNSAGMSVRPVHDAMGGGVDGIVTVRSVLLSQSSAYMVMALMAMFVMSRVPIGPLADRGLAIRRNPRRLDTGLVVLVVCAAAMLALLALVYVPGIGKAVNGSSRWIRIPGGRLTFQPSELAKWGLIGLTAWYAAYSGRRIGRFWMGLIPALIAIGAVTGLIVKEDLGTGVLIASACCVVLLAGGARLWQLLLVSPVAGVALVGAVITNPYRIQRLTAFLDPYRDPQATGYHMLQSIYAVAGGEGFGRGLGHGLQKFGYLPEDRTDFLFAVVCEELGIAGAAMVLAVYVVLIWSAYAVIRREPRPMLRLLGLGVVSAVGFQALINLMVVTGLGPTKGIALPLMSSGGTGWIMTAGALGLLVAMDRCHVPMAIEPIGDGEVEVVVRPVRSRVTVAS